jgi:hypothetical protein
MRNSVINAFGKAEKEISDEWDVKRFSTNCRCRSGPLDDEEFVM